MAHTLRNVAMAVYGLKALAIYMQRYQVELINILFSIVKIPNNIMFILRVLL
jgi:hypothetical protein